MSGIKPEKNKKFNPININNSYQPIINKSNKSNTIRHVGLQPLGKIGVNRRVPVQSLQQKEQQSQQDENGLATVTDSNPLSINNDDPQAQEQSQESPLSSQTHAPNSPKHDNTQQQQLHSGLQHNHDQLPGLDRKLSSAKLEQEAPQLASLGSTPPLAHSGPSHSLPLASNANSSHNSHRNTPPRLAAAAKPILTDKELENLDDISRQTKWASGKITIDYDAKLNFSDDEEDQPQEQPQEPASPPVQPTYGHRQDQRINDQGRDRRGYNGRQRSPPPRHRNHQPPLESQQNRRNSPPSHQISERTKQPDRQRVHSDQQDHHHNQSSRSQPLQQHPDEDIPQQQQQQQQQQPATTSTAAPLSAEQQNQRRDQSPQPVLNGSVKENKSAATKKTMSSVQVSQPRREGPSSRHNHNNYNSHHRNFHPNNYQHNHSNNNMNNLHHNHQGHHQPSQRNHNQHQRPMPMGRMNAPEAQQVNHAPVQHEKQPGPPMGPLPHSKPHHRLNAPSPAEQLALSTAKLQINMNNSSNNVLGGNNNSNNHHHSHHHPINDNGMNNNSNHNNHGNHHGSHRAPTAPRFMREHHNNRNNSPPYTGDPQRHNQQPLRQRQAHHSPQRSARPPLQQSKTHQPAAPQVQSPPPPQPQLIAGLNLIPAPVLPAPLAQPQNPQPPKPVARPQSQQAPPQVATPVKQEQPPSQPPSQPPPQPQRQLQHSRERDPPRQPPPPQQQPQQQQPQQQKPQQQKQQPQQQPEPELQSNKYRPVISRVFYRSDIKRISGGRQGDYK